MTVSDVYINPFSKIVLKKKANVKRRECCRKQRPRVFKVRHSRCVQTAM